MILHVSGAVGMAVHVSPLLWSTLESFDNHWTVSKRLELLTAAQTPRLNSSSQNQCSISYPHRSVMHSNVEIIDGVLGVFISWETIKYVDDSSNAQGHVLNFHLINAFLIFMLLPLMLGIK